MTYYSGKDPLKIRLCQDLQSIYREAKCTFEQNQQITGQEMYFCVKAIAERYGWIFEADIAGHLIGEFPHAYISKERRFSYIVPENTLPLRRFDQYDRALYWILEIKIMDANKTFAGFFEDLLSL